jgi:hypothetical protein
MDYAFSVRLPSINLHTNSARVFMLGSQVGDDDFLHLHHGLYSFGPTTH